MVDEIEYKGEWFIPDISKIKLSGTLKIKKNNQAILELICPFNLITKFFNSNQISATPQIDIICGISLLNYITLINCRYPFFFGVLKNEIVFKPNIVFIGKSFNKDSDILFNNMNIEISYLDKWTNINKTNIQESTDNNIKLEFKKPDPIQIFLDKHFRLSICFDFNKNITQTGDINLSSRPYLKIETEKEKERHYDDFLQMLYIFQRFLVLVILEPIYPLSLKGTTKDNEFVEIFYAGGNDTPEIIPNPDILFSLNEISKQLTSCFKNFIDKKDVLTVVFDIYLGTVYTKSIYVENLFLSLVFAIEAFHRRIIGGDYQDRKTYLEGIYNKLIEAIPNDINDDFKNSLISKLKYGYQYSMRKRLVGLIRILPIKIRDHLICGYSNDQFVDAVLETRNYLVHYEPIGNNKLDIRKAFNLVKKLKMLLHLLLLNEIGINIEGINWRILTR